MSKDSFAERGQNLEDLFFAKKNQELLDKMRQELEAKEAREKLSATSGISNPKVLDELISHKIGPETLAAVSFIPLVAVAWADGKLEASEKQAVLRAMKEKGYPEDSAVGHVVSAWLESAPSDNLFVSWKDYVRNLATMLSVDTYVALKQEVVALSTTVAESSGGFLGLVDKISRSEQLKLKEVADAFC